MWRYGLFRIRWTCTVGFFITYSAKQKYNIVRLNIRLQEFLVRLFCCISLSFKQCKWQTTDMNNYISLWVNISCVCGFSNHSKSVKAKIIDYCLANECNSRLNSNMTFSLKMYWRWPVSFWYHYCIERTCFLFWTHKPTSLNVNVCAGLGDACNSYLIFVK
jgi:hypothetical protein